MFLFSPIARVLDIVRPKTFDPIRKGDVVLFQERVEDPNKGLLYTDFSTQSLIDAEAIDLLRPLSPLSASRLSALDSVSFAINGLSEKVANLSND